MKTSLKCSECGGFLWGSSEHLGEGEAVKCGTPGCYTEFQLVPTKALIESAGALEFARKRAVEFEADLEKAKDALALRDEQILKLNKEATDLIAERDAALQARDEALEKASA